MTSWQIWIDTGGTFTDCIALDPAGKIHRAKVLSNSALRGKIIKKRDAQTLQIQEQWQAPESFVKGFAFRLLSTEKYDRCIVTGYDSANAILTIDHAITSEIPPNAAFEVQSPDEAPVLAARLVAGTPAHAPLPALEMRLATTRGTNALLERRGAPTALFITEGFGDLLLIGTQQRPDLFALEIKKPAPFYEAVIEAPERLDASGNVLTPINLEKIRGPIEKILSNGVDSAAIALMHSYLNPIHEHILADYLLAAGFRHVSRSSQLAPFIKILPRATTTVIDAYLGPVINKYLANVQQAISKGRLHVMTSAGGLVQPQDYHAKDSLLSGPAGGVVGAALSARQSGFEKIIAFDMGGTSTDACRFDGDYEYVFEHTVGDAHIVAPALAIESVAAGGGSICWFDGHRLRVGPESAGAHPGPACYGAGGPLTMTDVNLLLRRLDQSQFEIPINRALAESALQKIIDDLIEKTGETTERHALLSGFLEIANERMADAIRSISIRKGYDPTDYALLAFGGAGGQHACAIAELLDIQTVIIPPDASLLSALGIGRARIERFVNRQILQLLETIDSGLESWLQDLAEKAFAEVAKEGIPKNEIEIRRQIIHLRFLGQETSLAIDFESTHSLENDFKEKYRAVYGYIPDDRPIEVESLRVIASEKDRIEVTSNKKPRLHSISAGDSQRAYLGQGWREIPVFRREKLSAGAQFDGPALVFESHSAMVVYPGWHASLDGASALILQKT
ncbi:MAG: hydantoinase/oxoprolinase family protein [bacterium]